MKFKALLILAFLVILFIFLISNSYYIIIDQKEIKYLSIYQEYNTKEFVKIYVKLTDLSNSSDTKKKNEWFNHATNEIMKNISNSHIKSIRKSSFGFTIEITKEGFENLTKEPYIEKIVSQGKIPIGGTFE